MAKAYWVHTYRPLVRPLPALVAAVSLFLAACQSQPPAAPAAPAPAQPAAAPTSVAPVAAATQGGTVTIGLDQEPPTMDPEASPSAITFYLTSSAGETLLYVDE